MKSVRDLFSQLVSKSLVSSIPLSGSESLFNQGIGESLTEETDDQGNTAVLVPTALRNEDQANLSTPQISREDLSQSHHISFNEEKADALAKVEKMDPLVKVEDLQVKFLRLLLRFGQTPNNLLVAKVLYRIHLATLIRAGESDLKRVNHGSNRVRERAMEQEAFGLPELDFSIRILFLGKTGVGKSATINSIFEQTKTATSAFQPATDRIEEVVGTINGIKLSIIDTPGFLHPSTGNVRRNKKIMLSVKKYIRKHPPDIVFYFDRLDHISTGYSNFLLVQHITKVFGTGIWFNTILVMTHSSSALPEGPDGYPISYESYGTHCSDQLQNHVRQAVSDSRLENLVLLVENHPHCKRNNMGEKILPDGQVWKLNLLTFCISSKVLSDVNTLLRFQDSIELGPTTSSRLPSLPHLLSSLLKRPGLPSSIGGDYETEEIVLSETNEEDEYDDLPTIRVLPKSQFERLTKSQKKAYLDELDYRETLYLKKQLKEEYRIRREKRLLKAESSMEKGENSKDEQGFSPEAILLPDMSVPPNFDSDCPVHRYRGLIKSDKFLVRPVLDPQGWDHDVGFDGLNFETGVDINRNMFASIMGQLNKDKNDFSILSESSTYYHSYPHGPCYALSLDVQSSGKDLIYTVHTNTSLPSFFPKNLTDFGLSLTSFGNKNYLGAKVEDTILVGKRFKVVMNAGHLGGGEGHGQVTNGGSIEATLRGGDYPVRDDKITVTATVLSFDKEMVLSGNLQSEFRISRGSRVSVSANLNTRKKGQVCVKVSSSEHLQIGLIAVFTILKTLLRRGERVNESG